MRMVQYNPWNVLNNLQNELSRIRLHPAYDPELSGSLSTQGWNPLVDINEEKGRYIIKADVPGVDPDKIEITMENGVLALSGERSEEIKEEDQGYQRIERTQGAFIRRFTLPDTVDVDKVDASCRNGVIEIIVPKKEQAQPRRINLKAAS